MSGVRIPPPRPHPLGIATGRSGYLKQPCLSLCTRLDGGCSSPGRAPDCGSGGSGFETRQPPHYPQSRINAASTIELCAARLCNLLTDGVIHNDPHLFEAGFSLTLLSRDSGEPCSYWAVKSWRKLLIVLLNGIFLSYLYKMS